jgi:hypothetical protein
MTKEQRPRVAAKAAAALEESTEALTTTTEAMGGPKDATTQKMLSLISEQPND